MQYDETRTAMEFAGLTAYETWMHYCNMGGLTDYFELDAYLCGLYGLDPEDADLVSQAVNELIDDLCTSEDAMFCRAPYSWTEERAGSFGTDHEAGNGQEGFNGARPVRIPAEDLVEPHGAGTFGSRFLSELDVRALAGRPGVPLPPGAHAELLGEILDSGIIGRMFSGERNQR
ncbi:hypothetical protein [Arthrobacter sp. B1805]|uniref:hypothetical protein n=1 Tax=Arthrobacter sp. B1805 TaxID=2058892 RepID=UPI000CE571A1|nr:hypothetical protein [Arthrobacter sp. B1805]